MYKLHCNKAFKPINAGFPDMSQVVKALSPFAVATVQLSGTTQFEIRGKKSVEHSRWCSYMELGFVCKATVNFANCFKNIVK